MFSFECMCVVATQRHIDTSHINTGSVSIWWKFPSGIATVCQKRNFHKYFIACVFIYDFNNGEYTPANDLFFFYKAKRPKYFGCTVFFSFFLQLLKCTYLV